MMETAGETSVTHHLKRWTLFHALPRPRMLIGSPVRQPFYASRQRVIIMLIVKLISNQHKLSGYFLRTNNPTEGTVRNPRQCMLGYQGTKVLLTKLPDFLGALVSITFFSVIDPFIFLRGSHSPR
jgi:hypothetical protein